MTAPLDDNSAARDAVFARVRAALGKHGDRTAEARDAAAYVEAHARGPQPSVPGTPLERFMLRARDMSSTVVHVADDADVPGAVARYLRALESPAQASPMRGKGVCWPELSGLDWRGAGLAIEMRPTVGDDVLGITGCHCAIAETGTLVLLSGPATPTATALLPETHVAVVRAGRIVRNMEAMFALLRAEHVRMPRAVNMISGPSRTGDIEQTIVLGAHGPYRLHIVIVG